MTRRTDTPPPHLTEREMPGDVARAVLSAFRELNSTLSLAELFNVILRCALRTTGAEAVLFLLHQHLAREPLIFRLTRRDGDSIVDLPLVEKAGAAALETIAGTTGGDAPAPMFPPEAVTAMNDALDGTPREIRWFGLGRTDQYAGALALVGMEHSIDSDVVLVGSHFAEAATLALGNAVTHRQLQRRALENKLLLDSNELLLSTNDLDQILDGILTSLRRAVRYDAGGIYLVGDDGGLKRIIDWGYSEDKHPMLDSKARIGIVGHVAQTGEIALVGDVHADDRYQNARDKTRSELAIPIRSGWRTVGVFNLERDDLDGFRPRDVRFVAAFAEHAGVAIERTRFHRQEMTQRHLRNELEIARRIQQSFLPDIKPDYPGYDIAGLNVPSEAVGGDYYDFIPIVDSQLGIAIADVSGKGIPAALIMATFRASLIAEIRNNYSMRTIFARVNRLLCEKNDKAKFVSAIYGVLDMKHGIFTFANAGHNPGLLRRADGTIEMLREGGIAFGLLPEALYEERPVRLNSGDTMLLYTDGVTEAVNRGGEMFGGERLEEILWRVGDRPAEELLDRIYRDVLEFHDPQTALDDLTMLAIRVE